MLQGFNSSNENTQLCEVNDFMNKAKKVSQPSNKVMVVEFEGSNYTLFAKVFDELSQADTSSKVYYYEANGHRRLTLNKEPQTTNAW